MNNNKLRVIIRCIMHDNGFHTSAYIQELLCYKIGHSWPTASVSLEGEEKYWKYENSRDVVYGIFYHTQLETPEIAGLVDVTWSFYEDQQEAIWNKNTFAEEMFLVPEVEWVHIYVWKEPLNAE